ncbi:hypothetical protein LJC33_01035 [Eubacteriales bacterium OttesenSCG-928-N13]|nr:hypothetical protein [Eubacteriales bacterium OttesenSCG-928-N13]
MQYSVMSPEQFDKEKKFSMSLAALNSLREKGLLTKGEYRRLRQNLSDKYKPFLGSCFDESLDTNN